MLVGYMRVSSESDRQTTDLQRDTLLTAGVDERHLFEDKASGARDDRPGLAKALEFVRAGDCLVIWKLDRLGRSLSHLLSIVIGLKENVRTAVKLCGCRVDSREQSTINGASKVACYPHFSKLFFGYAYWIWRWFGMAVCSRETALLNNFSTLRWLCQIIDAILLRVVVISSP